MKVLQVVHSLPSLNQAGTEIYTQDLSLELAKRHEVYIFTRCSDTKQKEYAVTKRIIEGLPVYLINNTLQDCSSFERFYQNDKIDEKFASVLDVINPDIIHIQHLVFLSLGTIEKAKERNIPVVFTLHDYWLFCPKWHLLNTSQVPCKKAALGLFDYECNSCLQDILNIKPRVVKTYYSLKKLLPGYMIMSFKEIYSCFNKLSSINASEQLKKRRNSIEKTLENVDFFLAPSLYIKKQFEALGIHSDKIILHCPGLAIPKVRAVGKKIDNRIKFAFIGTIIPAKGVHILIKAFNGIKSDSAILRIYGKLKDYAGFGGYPQSLKAAKKNKNIEFIGEFCHEEVEKVLSTIDVLIVPSVWQENNPLIIREAFAARVPVVASRMGGIPETLVDGVNGLLFQPGSVNELRNKMQFIIDHPNIIDIFKSSLPQVKSIQEEINELEARYDKAVKANSYAMKDIFLS